MKKYNMSCSYLKDENYDPMNDYESTIKHFQDD